MATWIQPTLRGLQQAEQSNGLIENITAEGLTIKQQAEAAGTSIKQVPVNQTRIIRGVTYTANW